MTKPDSDIAEQIRIDVTIVMARIIIQKTGFTQNTYTEKITPSAKPQKGFSASSAYWAYILGLVEAHLEIMNPRNRVFEVTENFVRSSRTKSLHETGNAIGRSILKKLSSTKEK